MCHRKIKNRISIVGKVIYRSLKGQTLRLPIHNHLTSRIHLCWSNEADTLKHKDCIERSFIREKDWLSFCKALKMFRISGLAACIMRGITYEGNHRIQRSSF